MYLFYIICKILSNMSFYDGINKRYSISNKDLNIIYDLIVDNKSNLPINDRLSLITYNIINFKGKPYFISGLPSVDNKYLNPYNKRPNDKFFNHLNYNSIELRINNKVYAIGFNSFLNFIKPYIKASNFTDYYNRLSEFKDLELIKGLEKTFKNKKVFKINLSSIDIEKLNKNYLFFKNGLNIGEYRINFIKYDEFIKNIRIKSSYNKFKTLDNEFFNNSKYTKYDFLFNSIIIVVEKLEYDDKYNFILCNSIVKNDLRKILNLNKVNWYKSSKDELLKKIKYGRYEFLDRDDKKDELHKRLKILKGELKTLEKSLNVIQKDIELKEKYDKKDKLYYKNIKRLNQLNIEFNDIQDELIDINNDLIELDKKQDEYENNLLDYSNNLSLKLKSYLD